MFDQQDLIGAQQLLADDQGADRIPRVSSCVANDMSITQGDPKRCCWVDPGIHASHWDRSSLDLGSGQVGVFTNSIFLCRRQSEMTLLELSAVLLIFLHEVLLDGSCHEERL